ncbi:hypothetical protein AND4_12534 [Vibrio sp. AND4]|nr:hypothetical protein AND4_12534 [Vibrio sp. AND4]
MAGNKKAGELPAFIIFVSI